MTEGTRQRVTDSSICQHFEFTIPYTYTIYKFNLDFPKIVKIIYVFFSDMNIHTASSSNRPHRMNLSLKKSVSERGAFSYRLFGMLLRRVGLYEAPITVGYMLGLRRKC